MNKKGSQGAMVVFCTVPSEVARDIAGQIIDKKLAACVNVFPVRSIFRWEGRICDDTEELLIIKTTCSAADELTNFLVSIHPYDLPELFCLPVMSSHEEFLNWVAGEVDFN